LIRSERPEFLASLGRSMACVANRGAFRGSDTRFLPCTVPPRSVDVAGDATSAEPRRRTHLSGAGPPNCKSLLRGRGDSSSARGSRIRSAGRNKKSGSSSALVNSDAFLPRRRVLEFSPGCASLRSFDGVEREDHRGSTPFVSPFSPIIASRSHEPRKR